MIPSALLILPLLGVSGLAHAGTGTDELLSDMERVPPNVIFLVDRSVAMDSPCDGSGSGDSCLTDVKQAIGDVVRHFDFARYGIIGTTDSASDDSFYRIAPVGSSYAEISSALTGLTGSGVDVRNLTEVLEYLRDNYFLLTTWEDWSDTDGDGFTGDWGESPIGWTCSTTHVIVLTRDQPTGDDQLEWEVTHATVGGDVMCDATGASAATDVACYYDNQASNLYNRDENLSVADTQRVILHTIQLGTPTGALADALYSNAEAQTAGSGIYTQAATGSEILPSILAITAEIQSGIYTRSTPVVTSDGAYLIYDFYEVVGDNPLAQGHVRAYELDDDPYSSTYGQVLFTGPAAYGGAVWDGGDLLVSRPVEHAESNPGDHDGFGQRDIYTFDPMLATALAAEANTTHRMGLDYEFVNAVDAAAALDWYLDTSSTGTAAAVDSPYNLTYQTDGDSLIDSADLQALVDFARGLPTAKFRYFDLERGAWKLGDSPYAVPVVVTARDNTFTTDPTYRRFLENLEGDGVPSIVLVPANDGMLHAFALENDPRTIADDAGEELWAWVPASILWTNETVAAGVNPEWSNRLIDLAIYGRSFLFDGSPAVEDVWIDSNGDGAKASDGSEWHRIVVVQQGLGGTATLALDITDPQFPEYLWEDRDTSTLRNTMGYTVGKPVIVNLFDQRTTSAGHDRWTAMWGGGQAPGYTSSAGVPYYQTTAPNLYMHNVGDDQWGSDTVAWADAGSNAANAYPDLSTNGGDATWSELDWDSDGARLEHAYISAALAAVDVDSDGDHDIAYFPVTTSYWPTDMSGSGPSAPAVPGASWMYKVVFNSTNQDQPTWVKWYDPMAGTVDQSYSNAIAARPEVFYAATTAWRSDGTLGVYWGSGTPFDRGASDTGYFFAMYDSAPLDPTSTAKAITCDGHPGYYPLASGEGLTSSPVVYAGVVFFTTYEPNLDACQAGTGRLYALTWDACEPGMDTDGDGVVTDADEDSTAYEGYISGVTVTAQGTIYVGTANPDEGDEAPVGFQLPNSSLLNTAAISWMEMY